MYIFNISFWDITVKEIESHIQLFKLTLLFYEFCASMIFWRLHSLKFGYCENDFDKHWHISNLIFMAFFHGSFKITKKKIDKITKKKIDCKI